MEEKRLEEIEQLYTTGNLYESDEVPYVIAEMIVEIEELRAENEKVLIETEFVHQDNERMRETIVEMEANKDTLRAENDALLNAMKELLKEYESGRWLKLPTIIRNALGIEWKPSRQNPTD